MKKLNVNTRNNQCKLKIILAVSILNIPMCISTAYATIALDRTRAIITSDEKSISLNITNENKQFPYLANAWLENEKGEKINEPFTVLPPIQRVEAGAASQIKIQALPAAAALPQDRESVFYFRLREIPPKNDTPNTMQLAVQSRIKLFYRPIGITQKNGPGATPWQEKMTLIQQNGQYIANNPTPYFITIVAASTDKNSQPIDKFEPVMISPKTTQSLNISVNTLGNTPVLTYVNDQGSRPTLKFTCQANQCQVTR
ncbi:fimbria/pilus periplasmic chaperone [Providencia sp.]